jgi:HlyD family secretion protein
MGVAQAPERLAQGNDALRAQAVTAPNGPPPAPEKHSRSRLPFLVAAAAIVVALIAWFISSHARPVAGIEASGTIEATESDLSTKVQGRLVDLRVHDGDHVTKGHVLALLEGRTPSLNLAQARAGVASAAAQVAAAQAAYDVQKATFAATLAQAGEGVSIAQSNLGQAGENLGIEQAAALLAVDQAQAQLTAAQAAENHARSALARARSLFSTGDIAQQRLDDATNEQAGAAAQLRAASDGVALATANRRNVRIRELGVRTSRSQRGQSVANLASAQAQEGVVAQRRAQLLTAQAQLAAARAALEIAQDQVRETQVIAPFDGYVISHNFEVGNLVAPGSAVMTVGDLAHPYVNVYVSESDLPHVKSGMHANVTIDGMPGRTFAGMVTEISTSAEFTPENVQTKQQRIEYLSFRVKIQLTDTTGSLKPGLPADAVIPPE